MTLWKISVNFSLYRFCIVALWSSGRQFVSESEGPGFESWLYQVDNESLGKALYMHFLTPLMYKTSTQL